MGSDPPALARAGEPESRAWILGPGLVFFPQGGRILFPLFFPRGVRGPARRNHIFPYFSIYINAFYFYALTALAAVPLIMLVRMKKAEK